jgi:hypothetical protein
MIHGQKKLKYNRLSHILQLARMPHTRTETDSTSNAAHLSLLQKNTFEMTSRQHLDSIQSLFLETLAALGQENCKSVPVPYKKTSK